MQSYGSVMLTQEKAMLRYNIVVESGDIHSQTIVLRLGSTLVVMSCASLRGFIRVANEEGIYSALEKVCECERELLAFIYEEYHDEL